jgi:hypothetical protein
MQEIVDPFEGLEAVAQPCALPIFEPPMTHEEAQEEARAAIRQGQVDSADSVRTKNDNLAPIVRTRPNGRPIGPTQPQMNFIVDLLHDKQTTRPMQDVIADVYFERDWKKISRLIENLKAAPNKARTRLDADEINKAWATTDVKQFENMGHPSSPGEELWAMFKVDSHNNDLIIPRGSYALESTTTFLHDWENDLNFFSLWISDDGERWSLKKYESDDLVKLARKTQLVILDEIARVDPETAAKRYGLEKCRCGICHRKLTRDDSRERGIGPICAANYGWSF